jgi:TPR repeat protein
MLRLRAGESCLALASSSPLMREVGEWGDPCGQYNLGIMLLRYNQNVEELRLYNQNLEEAFRWFKTAADQGLAGAEFNTGFSYLTGKGVELNFEEARRFLSRAAGKGHGKAMSLLNQMDRHGH